MTKIYLLISDCLSAHFKPAFTLIHNQLDLVCVLPTIYWEFESLFYKGKSVHIINKPFELTCKISLNDLYYE